MKTISIVKKDFNSVLITVDGVSSKLTVMSFNTYAGVGDVCCLCISSANKKYELNLDPSVDTITIGETLFDGTGAELAAAIDTHMEQDLSVSQVVIYQRKTILTHAQILTLNTTPVILVPAPGEGKLLVLQKAIWSKTEHTTSYTGWGQADVILIAYEGGQIDASHGAYDMNALPGQGYSALGALLGNISGLENSSWVDYPTGISTDELINLPVIDKNGAGKNKAFVTYCSPTITGGHADNTIEVTVFYSIVDL